TKVLIIFVDYWFVFFFSSRRRHTRSYGDWSSDVCSSDLARESHDERGLQVAELVEHAGTSRARVLERVQVEAIQLGWGFPHLDEPRPVAEPEVVRWTEAGRKLRGQAHHASDVLGEGHAREPAQVPGAHREA